MGVNLQLSQHFKVIISPVQVASYRVAQFGFILMLISLQLVAWRITEYSVSKGSYKYLMAIT